MGLFKKKKQEEYNLLSKNGLVSFVKANLKKPTDQNVLEAVREIAKPDADQEHLTKDGELPWGWHTLNKGFTDKMRSEYSYFLNDWIEARKQSPKRQYETLESLVLWLNDAKKLCFSKNECFAKWFTSVIANDEYIAKRQAELDELIKNFDSLNREWNVRQSMLPDLEKNVKEKLMQYDGILQPEFVKMFDEAIQQDVKDVLYRMDKEGVLQRTKQGRSYVLHMK